MPDTLTQMSMLCQTVDGRPTESLEGVLPKTAGNANDGAHHVLTVPEARERGERIAGITGLEGTAPRARATWRHRFARAILQHSRRMRPPCEMQSNRKRLTASVSTAAVHETGSAVAFPDFSKVRSNG